MRQRSVAYSTATLLQLLDGLSWCPSCSPSCSTLRLPRTPRVLRPQFQPRRHASSLSSFTAVNASKTIPSRLRPLHQALLEVQKKAAAQVNLGRLQLALQGLESESPTVRVAVLGLNVQKTAKRLIRLLLADALEPEELWEKQLLSDNPDYSQGILIRYGRTPNANLPQSRTAIPVLQIPSSVLQRNNMELLLATVHPPSQNQISSGTFGTSDTLLAPMSGTPTAASGRHTVISQPVHRSMLVVDGLDELLIAAEMLASIQFGQSDRKLVDLAVSVESSSPQESKATLVFDSKSAEAGLAAIRTSLEKALVFEEKWIQSGLPAVSKWLARCSASGGTSQLSAPVRDLTSSILANAQSAILADAKRASMELAGRKMSSATRASLEEAVENFSRSAHLELQSGLASAWSSRNWRKLAWYKLFWRVDDVGLIVTDLISSAWLPATERSAYELSGRLVQAGISPFEKDTAERDTRLEPDLVKQLSPSIPALNSVFATSGAETVEPVLLNTGGEVEVAMSPVPQPKPLSSTISSARQVYMNDAILELTATAQQLVFRTLSITGLTAGLSGLAYFSITAGSIYEAGTIVALGIAFAARTMQTGWQRACKGLEEGLMGSGRSMIRHMEQRLHRLVQDGGKPQESPVEVEFRRAAEDAVMKAQKALQQLG